MRLGGRIVSSSLPFPAVTGFTLAARHNPAYSLDAGLCNSCAMRNTRCASIRRVKSSASAYVDMLESGKWERAIITLVLAAF